MTNLKIKKLKPTAKIPQYETAHAAGMDLSACVEQETILKSGERKLIDTGLAIELPVGYEAQIRPRSGLAIKKGISMVNAPGTIDADYRGELKVILINHGEEDFKINDGDRIAQMVIAPVVQVKIEEVKELSDTDRGSGGFGSTGKN